MHTSVLPTKKNSVKPQGHQVEDSSTGSTVLFQKSTNKFFLKPKRSKAKQDTMASSTFNRLASTEEADLEDSDIIAISTNI